MSIIQQLAIDPIPALFFLVSIVIAITVHEFAHAWTATQLGDETPRLDGRVTLDPRAHLDLLGSIAFLLFSFGWGKPVVYNPMRLRRKIDELLVALAGPCSNLIIALLVNLVVAALSYTNLNLDLLLIFSQVNLLLAAFNILPIPPLDGSAIIAYFWPEYRSLLGSQFGFILLLVVIFLPIGGSTLLQWLVTPVFAFFSQLTHLFGLLPSVGPLLF